MKFIRNIFLGLYTWFYFVMYRISAALKNVEEENLNSFGEFSERDKKNQRVRHRNKVLEKLNQGQRDEQFVKDFYEILDKADKFMINSTPEQIAMKADKYGMSYGQKDRWGRRYEHFGFFDSKHKHKGKTLKEVYELEKKERGLNDEDSKYELEYMYNNEPTEESFVTSITNDLVLDNNGNVIAKDKLAKTLERKYPMVVVRDNENCINKIEKLTQYLHVRKIADIVSKDRLLEFFVMGKYGSHKLSDDSEIIKEIVDIKQIFIPDEYKNLHGFSVGDFKERKKVLDGDGNVLFDVFKFYGKKIEKLN